MVVCCAARNTAAQQSDLASRRIVRVDVELEGIPSGNTSEIASVLEVAPGQFYSAVRIHDSLVKLHESGLASGARVEAEDAADGVALRFIIKPQARVANVVFEGTTIFQPADLRARLNQLDTGDKLSGGAVNRGLGELLAFYSSRGYYQAQIESEVNLDPTGTRATVVYRINSGAPATVSRFTIDVRGGAVDLSRVRHAIVEAQPFSQDAVDDELDRIRRAYLEADYVAVRLTSSVSADLLSNTVAVTISGESGPKVTVDVQGLSVDDDEKREILPFYTQGGVDEFTLEEGRRRIQEHAQREGYFFAEVATPSLPDLTAPTVNLTYVVEPGRRYKLKDIEITGLDAIPDQMMQDEMKSRPGSFLPFWSIGRGITSDDMLRQDANLVLKRLRELGYRKATVEVLRGVSVSGSDLIITFDVNQGPRSRVEEIAVRGNVVLTNDELNAQLTMVPGDPLVAADVSENVDRVLTAYTSRGFGAAEVIPEVSDLGLANGEDRVRLVMSVREGNRMRIRSVETRGLARTNRERLEDNFYRFKPGEWLQVERLQETERALYETNVFSSVVTTSEPVGQSPDGAEERHVMVDVSEAKRYDMITDLGFQTSSSERHVPGLTFLNGVKGLFQLTNNNMFGRLYTGTAQFRVSQDELLTKISFLNPRPVGLNYPLLISLLSQRVAERTFRSDRYAAAIQLERRFSEDLIAYLGYNFERVSVSDHEGPPQDIERNRQAIRLGRISPSFIRDKRDNFTDPTTGTLTIGSLSYATKFLGGSDTAEFIKVVAEHNRYYPVKRLRDSIYSFSVRIGLAKPIGGNQDLPISERFFAGGARDLRGFGFEEAGPRETFQRCTDRSISVEDCVESGSQLEFVTAPLGGNALIVINNEIRFPIWRSIGGAAFSDTGNVFSRVSDLKFKDLTQTLGFGLRLKTPIGPVRLDLGSLVINRPEGVSRVKVHFSIGQTF